MGEIVKLLGQHGIYGLIILGLGAAVFYLWRHTNVQQQQIIDLQNLRVAETKEVSKEMQKFSEGISEAMRDLGDIIKSVGANMESLREVVKESLRRD